MCVVYAKFIKTMSDKYYIKDWNGTKHWIPKSEVQKKEKHVQKQY